jgi:hypothetical protein
MSGSLVWRTYTTDAGVGSSVFRDESNAESTIGTATCLTAFVAGNPGLNSLVKPRYVNTQFSTDPTRRKRFIIGLLATYNSIGAGSTVVETGSAGGTWNVTSKVGERSRIPTSVDTGQTDGDAT